MAKQNEKKRTVVYIGAGLSKALGYKLTSELLPEIWRRLNKHKLFYNAEKTRATRSAINKLLPGFKEEFEKSEKVKEESKKGGNIMITDLLSLIDYSLANSNIPILSEEVYKLINLRRYLEEAICRVLEPPPNTKKRKELNKALRNWLNQKQAEGEVCVISTNYDIAIENLLFEEYEDEEGEAEYDRLAEDFDFGFPWRNPYENKLYVRPSLPKYRIYKVHGSLNWLRCDVCEHIYVNIYSLVELVYEPDYVPKTFLTCHCGHYPLSAVLVTPSLVRNIQDVNLLEIWRNSLEMLRTADEWYMIGSAFLPEDIALRSLFVRAYQGRRQKPAICVVQYCSDPPSKEEIDTEARYRTFFEFSSGCDYQKSGLQGFLQKEERNLRNAKKS